MLLHGSGVFSSLYRVISYSPLSLKPPKACFSLGVFAAASGLESFLVLRGFSSENCLSKVRSGSIITVAKF